VHDEPRREVLHGVRTQRRNGDAAARNVGEGIVGTKISEDVPLRDREAEGVSMQGKLKTLAPLHLLEKREGVENKAAPQGTHLRDRGVNGTVCTEDTLPLMHLRDREETRV
jgi:hypothetical protein